MMYLLFRYKKWKPSEYFRMPEGEKRVTRFFMQQEIEDRKEEIEDMMGG